MGLLSVLLMVESTHQDHPSLRVINPQLRQAPGPAFLPILGQDSQGMLWKDVKYSVPDSKGNIGVKRDCQGGEEDREGSGD